ncbi:MAG: ATPase, T2SS/T4P/T4SS family, partial [Bacteriovoracaceae bacterium]
VTRLVARDERPDDLKSFMSHAMRMSPERIVLGELRSGEVEPYLLAMNSGHKGVLSSIHANSALDAIHRVALLARLYSSNPLEYELVLKLVCQNIDAVVYMENKKVKEIIEVFGSEGNQIFYEKKAAEAAAI